MDDELEAESLRRRVARRRRTRHAAVGLAGLVVASAMAGGAFLLRDDGATVDRVVTSPGPDPTDEPLALPDGTVVSNGGGVFVIRGGSPQQAWDQPAHLAYAVGGLLVAQRAEGLDVYPHPPAGPVVVVDAGEVRELPTASGERLRLLDAGSVDGRTVALISSQTGGNPVDDEERLVLVDLADGARTDLGVVGGWEEGVMQARLLADGVAYVLASTGGWTLQRRGFDGVASWTVEGGEPGGGAPALTILDGSVTLVQARFDGEGLAPVLDLVQYDPASGGERARYERRLVDAEVDAGFCFHVETSGGFLLCDRSGDAGLLVIDPTTGRTDVAALAGVPTVPHAPSGGGTGTSAPEPATPTVPLGSVNWDAVSYPMDCGGVGSPPLQVVLAEPAPGIEVAVVLVACAAGAGSPPRTIFVYDRADSVDAPHLLRTLWQDGWLRLTASVAADGAELVATGGTYSSRQVTRCCPDGTFTTRWSWSGDRYVETSTNAPP